MGTYRMGDDPKTSVVDLLQCSHDHPNLYLVGSGTFPTVGTANPTLTLSALALGPRKASSRNSNCTSNDEYRGTLTRPFSKHIRFRGRRQATYCNSEEEFNAVVAPYMTVVGDTQ